MLITIFAYMKNRFPRHSARTVGSPTRSITPYAYCANNPVCNVDLDGKKAIRIIDEGNKTVTIKADYYVVTSKS